MMARILPWFPGAGYVPGTMETEQFCAALEKLGLTAEEAATWLGVSRRAAFNYQSGTREVPEPIARLLRLVIKLNMSRERAAKLMMKDDKL